MAPSRRRCWILATGIAVLVAVGVAVGVTLGVLLGRDKDASSNTDNFMKSPDYTRHKDLNPPSDPRPVSPPKPHLMLSLEEWDLLLTHNLSTSTSATINATAFLEQLELQLQYDRYHPSHPPPPPQWQAMQWLLEYPHLVETPVWRKRQLFGLATFYFSMNGPQWPTQHDLQMPGQQWLDYDTPECHWYSSTWDVPVCNADGRYTILSLQHFLHGNSHYYNDNNDDDNTNENYYYNKESLNNNDKNNDQEDTTMRYPSLPPEMAFLDSLTNIWLNNNGIQGSIPTTLGLLENLQNIVLANNSLTGHLPSELGLVLRNNHVALLNLANNSLSGELPRDLFQEGHVATTDNETDLIVRFNHNRFTGVIVSDIAKLTRLQSLHLDHNRFTGAVSKAWSRLTRLSHLDLSHNHLSSSLPSSLLGNLSPTLRYLAISHNALSGTIPSSELAELTALQHLDLSFNRLQGSFPVQLGNLVGVNNTSSSSSLTPSLRFLDLRGNVHLSGTVPQDLCVWQTNQSVTLDFDCTALLCGCDCHCPSRDNHKGNETDATATTASTRSSIRRSFSLFGEP